MKTSFTSCILILTALLALPACANSNNPKSVDNASTETNTTQKSNQLPFVGKALFSFGGNAAEQHIRITEDGHTIITEHTRSGGTVVYEGTYQSHLPIIQNGKTVGFYAIKGSEIHELDTNKQPITGCVAKDNDDAPCVAELERLIPAG